MANVIVVGCGRVGSQLAMLLSESEGNVCVVDRRADALSNLSRNFNGTTLQGEGFDEDVLIRAGVEEADVVAAVTQSDSTNFMVAETARRIFHVPHVLVRLYNPARERAHMQLGLDYVCGTSLVAEEIFSKIMAGHGSHLDTFGDFEILRFSFNLESTGQRQMRVSDLERSHDVRVVAFERRDGSASSIPSRDSVLYHGDSVIACIRHELLGEFSKFMQ